MKYLPYLQVGDMGDDYLPQILVKGEVLPEVWEKSLELLWNEGYTSFKESYKFETEKDRIRECSMRMVVKHPLKEPRFHMEWGRPKDFDEYSDDVILGKKDHLIGEAYDYTYHDRIFQYKPSGTNLGINQVEYLVEKLKKTPYSNRAQAVTWMAWKDEHPDIGPPCLQIIWSKVIDRRLEMHTYWRSRDAYAAAPMNMWALTNLQKIIADKLGVEAGQYVDTSESFHVYEENFQRVQNVVNLAKARRESGRPVWLNSEDSRLRDTG
jgi:thymidylate synthase